MVRVSEGPLIEDGNSQLTDEELARRLQAEWLKEDSANSQQSAAKASTPPAVTSPQECSTVEPRHEAGIDTQGETSVQLSSDGPNDSKSNLARERPEEGLLKPEEEVLALQSSGSDDEDIATTIPFDEHPLTFEPSKYLEELKRQWQSIGGEASYGLLTRAFVLINSTTSRIKTVDTLVNFLRLLIEGDPESLLPAVSSAS